MQHQNSSMVIAICSIILILCSCQHRPAIQPISALQPSEAVTSFTAEGIIENHIEALGGRAEFKKIHTKKTVSDMVFFDMKTHTKLYLKSTIFQERPNKYYAIIKGRGNPKLSSADDDSITKKINLSLKGKVLREYGTDGSVVWDISREEASIKRGIERTNLLISYAFDFLEHKRLNINIHPEIIGTEKVQNKLCYKLEMTPSEGTPFTIFIDTNNFLLLKIIRKQGPEDRLEKLEILLDDYKKVDGILVPHKFNMIRSDRFMLTGVTQSVETNINIPEDHFALPQEIQEMKQVIEL